MKYLLESYNKVRPALDIPKMVSLNQIEFCDSSVSLCFSLVIGSPGAPSSTWWSSTPRSRCSLRRGPCSDKWTRLERK